jgi:hypothetical protein
VNTSQANIRASMGGYGGTVRTAGTYTGKFCAIKAMEDSVVTATGNITGLTSLTILGGDVVPGEFTSVTVASGKVILYYNIEGEV